MTGVDVKLPSPVARMDVAIGRIPDLHGSLREGPESSRKCLYTASRKLASLPEADLRQSRLERPRLGDLHHFRCRREAFKRRREDRVRLRVAAGRLIKLR